MLERLDIGVGRPVSYTEGAYIGDAMKAILTFLAFVLAASGALSQAAAPPVGMWVHTSGRAFLSIDASGYCHYQDPGLEYGGGCSWNAGSAGGILTVMNAAAVPGPQPIYLNILWVDQGTISVFGDIFRLQQ